MADFFHESSDWPRFTWQENSLMKKLGQLRYMQGRMLAGMEQMGPSDKMEAILNALTEEAMGSGKIENEVYLRDEMLSAIARSLRIRLPGMVPASGMTAGLARLVTEAARHQDRKFSPDLLCSWHSDLFPTDSGHLSKIVTGKWRKGPLSVNSAENNIIREHFRAPSADRIPAEMKRFIHWLNQDDGLDEVLRSAIAHLWFLTIHPFEDGNGQVARAISLAMLGRSEDGLPRFYSLSSVLLRHREAYFKELEQAQRGNGDITEWINWYLDAMLWALEDMNRLQQPVISRHALSEKMDRESLKPRQKRILRKLQDNGLEHFTSTQYAGAGNISQDTAIRDIRTLMSQGLLRKLSGGGRSTRYAVKKQHSA